MYNLRYNDVDLSGLIKVLEVKKSILPTRNNYTVNIPNSHGEYYLGFKYGAREIELKVALISETAQEYNNLNRVLADALNVETPQQLFLGEENDKYYYAVPDASDNLEQIVNVGTGTLKFTCYDPLAYSDEEKVFEGDPLTGITTVNNDGLDAPPIISVGFNNTAHFLQVTNYDGKTILVGQKPSVNLPNKAIKPTILDDNCKSISGWTPSSDVLDGVVNSKVMGSTKLNKYGTGITGKDYGSYTGAWHGPTIKKKLSTESKGFEAVVEIAFNSKDVGVSHTGDTGSNGNAPTSGTYKVSATPCLRIRKGRSTSDKQVGQIPNKTIVKVTEISGGWGKVTYKNATGYISMKYLKKYTAPTTNYKVSEKVGVNLRKGRGTKYGVITTMPYNTTLNVTDIKDGWGKVSYKGRTGYCAVKYLTKTATSTASTTTSTSTNNTSTVVIDESYKKMGRIEVALFDTYNMQIGKFVVADNSEYYETVQPEVYIGTKCVLTDANKIPKPKKEKINKKSTEVYSGKYGAWNDGSIRFTLSRIEVKGQMQWRAKIQKVQKGKVTKTISSNTLVNKAYSTENLSSVVMWFAQYNDVALVDTMSVEDIKIKAKSSASDTPENKPIFKNGDELVLNCEENKIYKNGVPYMDHLDIGSEFFNCGSGDSQFIATSDDRDINVLTGLRERYL